MVLKDQMQQKTRDGEGAIGGVATGVGWNAGGGGGGGGYVSIYTDTPLINIKLTDAIVYHSDLTEIGPFKDTP